MFLESPRFPDAISLGAVGGPGYSTDIVVVNSGAESRNINWSLPLSSYDVAHGVRSPEQMDVLIAFFRTVKGRGHSFRFKDWTDFQVSPATSGLTLIDDTAHTYQLAKRYINGDETETRPIQKPVAESFALFSAGVQMITGYALDATTGIVTLDDTGVDLTWSGEFDVPCRFDTDVMKITMDARQFYSWGQIPVVEIRL